MPEEESELSNLKKMVRDLSLKIEESNSKPKLCMQVVEKLKHKKRVQEQEQSTLVVNNADNFVSCAEVMRDMEKVKRDLCKLKLEVDSVLEEKNRAENESKGSNSRMCKYLKLVDALKQEIKEVNDEQVLVELAQIEASKELVKIEVQRKEETKYFSSVIEDTKRKVNESLEEIDRTKELEMKLALANTDINMLENKIKIAKELDGFLEGNETESPLALKSVIEELGLATNEFALIREVGFQLMTSMDEIRDELTLVSGKIAWLKKKEEKTNKTVEYLNSKLLRAKLKLEDLSSSKEKAKTIVDNLFLNCQHRKAETEAFKKERELSCEEIVTLKAQIEKNKSDIELAEMKLDAAMQELEALKSSELVALEKLRVSAEKTMIHRASVSKHSSMITISKFEYKYLMGSAAKAKKVADKKVAAARAWVEALKASKEEICLKTELGQRTIEEKRQKEEETVRREKLAAEKRTLDGEWKGKWEESSEVENLEFGSELCRKSTKKSWGSTPVRRMKLRIATSPSFRHTSRSSPFNAKRREKIVPNLGKLFNRKKH